MIQLLHEKIEPLYSLMSAIVDTLPNEILDCFLRLNLAEIISILYYFDWSRASKRICNTVSLMGLVCVDLICAE